MAELDPHFFRHESGRLVAVLVRVFGVHNLALSEDVAQDTLCRALEVWKLRGVPENPSAWLTTSAKNRAIDLLRRERTRSVAAPELGRLLDSEWTLVPTLDELFATQSFRDDELRMMFSLAEPRLPETAQIALILQLSCGFSVDEIGAALFTSPAAVEKRLSRAKKVVATSRRLFDLAGADLPARLATVQRALYLLFNEGYHGACPETAVRHDLCREALRLGGLLCEHPLTGTPATHALGALMFLHAARLTARVDAEGQLRALFEQDRSQWDAPCIERGLELLDRSASGSELSEYHLEAAIAAHHSTAPRMEDTAWHEIVTLYTRLLELRPSPVVALSRAIAIAQAEGPNAGLEALQAIAGREQLASYPFYEAALGELLLRAGQNVPARGHFLAALELSRNAMERRFFSERLSASERR